ncbi:MAG: hypothetical protein D6761_10530 [Candidatus Dadabacteria bacterium]|nr:MAG: hypothetical protein D6761_10530 [Candidatus Dadabacteria bacterium]
MRRLGAIVGAAILVLSGCIGAPVPPRTGVALSLDLPGPLVPEGFAPQQATEVVFATEGKVWIEIRTASNIIHSELYAEDDGGATIVDLEPGQYTLGVYGGILTRDQSDGSINGVIRFAAVESLSLPPDEVVQRTVTLVRCEDVEDQLDTNRRAMCDSDFGTQLAPPDPPEIFPTAAFSGCQPTAREDGIILAGTKVTGTVLMDNAGDVLVADTGRNWQWNVFDLTFGETSFARNLLTAWEEDTQIRSEQTQVSFSIETDALCFNPYNVQSGGADIETSSADAAQLVASWTPRNPVTDVALLVTGTTSMKSLLTDAELSAARSASLYPSAGTVSSSAGTLSFPRPTTDRWDLYLYARHSQAGQLVWRQEGAFRYDADWLTDNDHPAAP